MDVLEFLAYLPGIQIHDQPLAFGLFQSHDGVNIAHRAEERLPTRLGMLGDDWVRFGMIGLFREQNFHAAIIALIFFTIGTLGSMRPLPQNAGQPYPLVCIAAPAASVPMLVADW